MMMMGAIDPGVKGGLFVIDFLSQRIWVQEINLADFSTFQSLLLPFFSRDLSLIILEKPLIKPGLSVKSLRTVWFHFGRLYQWFEDQNCPCFLFTSQSWTNWFDQKKQPQGPDQKQHRAQILVELGFPSSLLKTKRGRFLDGIVDAAALFLTYSEKEKGQKLSFEGFAFSNQLP